MGTLDGKTIVISGAARGQGRSHALSIAGEGGNVIALDICGQIDGLSYPLASEEDMAATVAAVEEAGGGIVARTADVRDQDAIDAAVAAGVAEFGGIDGAVANAGLWDLGPTLWETTEELWGTVIDASLSGAWRLIKSVSPHLIERRAGSVVVISSINGIEAADGYGSYVVAKHGLIGLTRQAAYELAKHNVRVNAIAPGAMDTRIWNNEMGYKLFGAETRADAINTVYGFAPLAGRSALPAQATSNAVVWLLSELADQVTGIVLPIDAGHLLQPGWNPEPQMEGAEADRHRPPAVAPE